MLPSSQRLSVPLFKKAIESGKIFHSPLFSARLLKVEGISRFSVAVPKKVAKTAVERNKVRRRVYSVLRTLDKDITTGIHGVFIAKPPLLTYLYVDIAKEMGAFFVKIGLMK